MQRISYYSIFSVLLLALPLAAQDWKQWGGTNRDFKIENVTIAGTWPEAGPQKLWEQALGDGNSGIVIKDQTAVTVYRNFDGKSAIGDEEIVLAVDTRSGEKLWEYRYDAPGFKDKGYNGEKGPHASPLIVGDQVYILGYTAVFTALDLKTGQKIWASDFLADFGGDTLMFGNSTSPIVHDDHIVVPVFSDEAGLIAFDPDNGRVLWKTERIHGSYGSPMMAGPPDNPILVMVGRDFIFGISPTDGKTIWKHAYEEQGMTNIQSVIPLPENHLFCAGQGLKGGALFKMQDAPLTGLSQVWHNNKITLGMGNPIVDGDIIYAGNSRMMYAFDWREGKILWRQRGYSDPKLIKIGDKSLILDDKGHLTLATLTPSGVEAHSRFAISAGRTWTAPIVIGQRLYFRDRTNIKAFDLSPEANASASPGTVAVTVSPKTAVEQLFLDGETEQAMAALRAYGKTNPDSINDDWIGEIGRLLYSQDLTDAAGHLFQAYIKKQPESATAYRGLREFYQRKEMTGEMAKLDDRFLIPIKFEVTVPQNTPADAQIYLAGNARSLGGWSPTGVALEKRNNGTYSAEVKLPRNGDVQFKVTRGEWGNVETNEAKEQIDNRKLEINKENSPVKISVIRWADM